MKNTNIIGREEEIHKLLKCYQSNESQLVVVYGRRRVGKTFLVTQTFANKFTLRFAGAYQQSRASQLENFADEMRRVCDPMLPTPKSWKDAFGMMRTYLESLPLNQKQVVFIDEMPWMDTQKSDFFPSFEYFWNQWGASQSNLLFIVCGSATTWMTEKFSDNPGGLFNRHATRIYLHPFTLAETEQYLQSRHIEWSRYDIAECYMAMGGIPYYLSQLDSDKTYNANIDSLFFRQKGELWDEFQHLYRTLFRNSEQYQKVVEVLSSRRMGMNRDEIAKKAGFPNNGVLTKMLKNLADSDFIRPYCYFGKKKQGTIYQLCDNYTLFYYQFVKGHYGRDEHFWTNTIDNPARKAWAGNAFELLCKSHIQQIKRKLGILGVLSEKSVWYSQNSPTCTEAQVDLLIDRRDRVINLCEMKYSISPYTIDKDYDMRLRNKMEAFRAESKTRKALHLTMVTTYGVKRNAHSSLVQSEVTLDDLFQPYVFFNLDGNVTF